MSTSAAPLPRLVATDFFAYYRPSPCERRVWLRKEEIEQAPPGPYVKVLMGLGLEHERRHLARFPSALDLGQGTIPDRARRTHEAVESGADVIYQGVLRAEAELSSERVEVVGVPDFMLRANRSYAIRDSKLNRRLREGAHPEIELQLETYGWLFEEAFGEPPASLQVHGGTGEIHERPYEGGKRALEALDEILRIRHEEAEPDVPVAWSKCAGCGYFERCWPVAVERRDVSLVNGVDLGLADELHRRGVTSAGELLEHFDSQQLAELQRPWGQKRMRVGDKAARILAAARATASGQELLLETPAIPESVSYVMFDLEGLPPQLDELEKIYLWGLQVFGERPGPFRAATAGFAPRGDREGWEVFLREAEAIFAEHGDIPFCHWASYERVKIDLYLSLYGDRSGIAARVRRNLCDLLPITQAAVALPFPSYGLKQIERHVGFRRIQDDFGGEWSMARYIEAIETADEHLREEIMDEILTYNREDLEATWAVLCWLRRLGSPT
jgi:predicted RecB family nuclease